MYLIDIAMKKKLNGIFKMLNLHVKHFSFGILEITRIEIFYNNRSSKYIVMFRIFGLFNDEVKDH